MLSRYNVDVASLTPQFLSYITVDIFRIRYVAVHLESENSFSIQHVIGR